MTDIEQHSSLVNRVVLVNLSFGVLGNTRKVPTTIFDTTADKKLLKGQKTLLDSPELEAIKKADGQIRAFVHSYCLNYSGGLLILPLGFKHIVHERLTAYEAERKTLVQAFVDAYPQRVVETGQRLGDLSNIKDYCLQELVANEFYFEYQYLQFAPPGAEQMAELTDEAKAKFEEKMATVSDQVTMLMRQTALELVEHFKSALEPSGDGKAKRLFQSNVVNIQEFVKTFKDRNITQDAELEKIISYLGTLVHPGFSVDVLRDDEDLKQLIHGQMSEITAQLGTMVETLPGRKFKNAGK